MADATDNIRTNETRVQAESGASAGDNGEGELRTPPRRKRRWLLIAGLVLLVIALIVGIPYYLHWRQYETTDNASIEAHIVPISPQIAGRVQAVYVDDNQKVKKGDRLVQIDPSDAEARLAAAKAALAVAEAKHQGAGSSLDLTRITSDAGVDQARAGVEIANSAVASAKTQVAAAQSAGDTAEAQAKSAIAAVAQARADLVASEAEVVRADTDLKRYEALKGTNAVAATEITAAEAAARAAHARRDAAAAKVTAKEAEAAAAKAAVDTAAQNVKKAQAALVQTKGEVAKAQAMLQSAESAPQQVALSKAQAEGAAADIQQARARVRQAELDLSYTLISAPESGRVTRKSVEAGSYVQIGQNLLAIVPDEVWAIANFKETQLTLMRPGQPAWITVDAYPGERFQGHVDSIQAGTGARFSLLPPENATGNWVKVVQRVPVKIVLDQSNPQQRLVPGMSVDAEVKVR